MDMTGQSEFSRRFAEKLFSAFPAFRDLAIVEGNSFVVEVTAPNPAARAPLFISTADEEVTVGFDAWHCHFDGMLEKDDEEIFASSIALVRDLLAERVAVLAWLDGDQWLGSSCAKVDEVDAELQSGDTGYAITWRGTHDRRFP